MLSDRLDDLGSPAVSEHHSGVVGGFDGFAAAEDHDVCALVDEFVKVFDGGKH